MLGELEAQVQVAISSGVLDITCKKLEGRLHLDRFGSGNRGKCIEAYGQTFTPTEFEVRAPSLSLHWRKGALFWRRSRGGPSARTGSGAFASTAGPSSNSSSSTSSRSGLSTSLALTSAD